MQLRLSLDMLAQPDETTCGPTCLQAVLRYWGHDVALPEVIEKTTTLDEGGTLGVHLGCQALARGLMAKLFTYNLQVFDPTWFGPAAPDLSDRLARQLQAKPDNKKLKVATRAYQQFLSMGGKLRYEDLTTQLIRRHLERGQPIIAGLSATYLYQTAREKGAYMDYDDVAGEPTGHFVVLCGYDRASREVLVADPLRPNPMNMGAQYPINIDRLVCSILLGVLTWDANLLLISPP